MSGDFMPEDKVSVIIAVYNGADFVKYTLDSILLQTYKNLEIIVVDDASTDNSRDVISSFIDSRIKTVFLEKNRNVCYAANKGLSMASGNYIAFCGHDDLWKSEKIEKQITFLQENEEYGACFSCADVINENNEICNAKHPLLRRTLHTYNYPDSLMVRKMFFSDNKLCASSAFIRKKVLDETGGFRYGLVQCQDYDLWMRILAKTHIYIVPEILTLYRKFSVESRNLSSVTQATQNRTMHETQWLMDDFLFSLTKERFKQIFSKDMTNPAASTDMEILCEKIFLLSKTENCFAVKRWIELLEDEEFRNILEEKYNFELTDFYKWNQNSMLFDANWSNRVGFLEQMVRHYENQK